MHVLLRGVGVWYNLLYYSPLIRNKLEIGERQDLPLDPSDLKQLQLMSQEEDPKSDSVPVPEVLLEKDSHEWEMIVKVINQEGELSPALSHWFLSCISQIVWKKDTPRKKVFFSSKLRYKLN